MGAVLRVGDDKREIRQCSVGLIGSKLGKWHKIGDLHGAVSHVAEIRSRIVALEIGINITAGVANAGQALCVRLPGFTGRDELADDVVVVHGTAERVGNGQDILRDYFAGGQ